MKAQKAAGNTETLVNYEKIGLLAKLAADLYANYRGTKDSNESLPSGGDVIDLDILQSQVDHIHITGRVVV